MGYLDTWTIYDHPSDYPDHWVVRPFRSEDGRVRPGMAKLADTLEEARALVPIDRFGLHRMEPSPGDDPVIAETWI